MGHRMGDWIRRWGQGGSDDSEVCNSEVVVISSSSGSSSSDDDSSEGTNGSEYVMVGDSDTSVETDPSEVSFGSTVCMESNHFSSLDIGGGVEADVPSPYGATEAVYQVDMVAIPTRYEDVEILVPSTEIIEISSDDTSTSPWDEGSPQQVLPEIPMPHVYVSGYGVHPYMPSEEMLDLYGQPFAIPSPVYSPNYEGNQTVQGESNVVTQSSFEEAVPYDGRPLAYFDPEATMADFWKDWGRDAQHGGPIDPQLTGEDGTSEGMLPAIANLATFFGIQVGGEPANQEVPAIDPNNEVVEERVPVENPNQVETVNHVEVGSQVVEENPNQDGEDTNRVEVEHHDDDEKEDMNREEAVAVSETPAVWEMGSSSGRRPAGRLRFRSQARKRVPVPERASMPCRVCGGHGHYTHACPNERQGRPLRRNQITCYSCGMRGHYATSCPGTPTPSPSSLSSTSARRPSGRRGRNSG